MHRRRFGTLAATGGLAGLAGCLVSGDTNDAASLDGWPPPETDGSLTFWTWQHFWGNQSIAYQHVRDLDEITRETVPAPEQYRRLEDGDVPDVVHCRSAQFERAVDDGLLQPLPADVHPQWPPDGRLRSHDETYYQRDGDVYGIPQTPLAFSLAYNPERLDEPTSWDLLWDESLEGRIAMPSDPVLAGQIAALRLGQDPLAPDDVDAIRAALVEQEPLVADRWTDWLDCWRSFDDGEILAAVLPNPRMCLCSQDGVPIRMAAPEEGVLYSQNTLAIPAGAENTNAALAFLDWGADFKTGTERMWEADEWELYHRGAVDDDRSEQYRSAAADAGIAWGGE